MDQETNAVEIRHIVQAIHSNKPLSKLFSASIFPIFSTRAHSSGCKNSFHMYIYILVWGFCFEEATVLEEGVNTMMSQISFKFIDEFVKNMIPFLIATKVII